MEHHYLSLGFSFLLSASIVHAQGPASDIAPNFILSDIDGVEHDMHAQLDQGKVVILDFWAIWCEPCFESFPAIEQIWNMHGPEGDNTVMIYGLEMDNITWDEEQVRDDLGIEYPIFNNGHFLHPDWNLEGYPSYAIICPDRSWELIFGNIGNNPNYLLPYVNACPPPSTMLHDARPIDYVGTVDLCQASDFVPEIRIQSRGADVMTSAAIEVWANGTLHYTYPWTGSLQQYHVSDTITMPAIAGLGPSGDAQFVITQVNGAADSAPGDNTLVVSIGQSLPGVAVQLELQTDEFNWSVAYALYDGNGTLVDTLDVPMDEHIVQDWVLEPGTCYRFLITDYLGEGMGNQGFYKLRDSQGVIFEQGGQFGYSAQHTFFVDGQIAGIEAHHDQTSLNFFPNPSDGQVMLAGDVSEVFVVDVFDATGALMMHAPITGAQPSIHFGELANGFYQLSVVHRDGSRTKGRILLSR
jgi:thiol-disulfide isomerase/thioredoxin